MKIKIAIWIFTCFILSLSVVFILFEVSIDMRKQQGSFLRQFPPHPAIEGRVLDLEYNSYYIAGGTRHHIYLANYSAPLHLVVANATLTDTQHVQLNVKEHTDQNFWAARVHLDSPYFYITDGVVPIIYRGNVHDWRADRYLHDKSYFQDIVPLSPESFFIRALGKPLRENIMGKLTSVEPHVQMKEGILKKQVDGIFCTDGMMHYNKVQGELVYLYRYRNECIVMDTNLQVLRSLHTIDTTTRAKIKVATIQSSGSTTLASSSQVVNKYSSVWNNLLFVNSMMLAKNEYVSAHDRASVIDVYHLPTGNYQFSFYIYNYHGNERLRQFNVFGDKLFALFDGHIQTWDLMPQYFKDIPIDHLHQ